MSFSKFVAAVPAYLVRRDPLTGFWVDTIHAFEEDLKRIFAAITGGRRPRWKCIISATYVISVRWPSPDSPYTCRFLDLLIPWWKAWHRMLLESCSLLSSGDVISVSGDLSNTLEIYVILQDRNRFLSLVTCMTSQLIINGWSTVVCLENMVCTSRNLGFLCSCTSVFILICVPRWCSLPGGTWATHDRPRISGSSTRSPWTTLCDLFRQACVKHDLVVSNTHCILSASIPSCTSCNFVSGATEWAGSGISHLCDMVRCGASIAVVSTNTSTAKLSNNIQGF